MVKEQHYPNILKCKTHKILSASELIKGCSSFRASLISLRLAALGRVTVALTRSSCRPGAPGVGAAADLLTTRPRLPLCRFVCVCACTFSEEGDSPKTFIQDVSRPGPVCTSAYQDLMKPLVCLSVCMCGSFVLLCDSRCWVHRGGCNRSSSVRRKRSFLTMDPFYFAQSGRDIYVCV